MRMRLKNSYSRSGEMLSKERSTKQSPKPRISAREHSTPSRDLETRKSLIRMRLKNSYSKSGEMLSKERSTKPRNSAVMHSKLSKESETKKSLRTLKMKTWKSSTSLIGLMQHLEQVVSEEVMEELALRMNS